MTAALDRITAAMQDALLRNMDGYYSGLLDAETWWATMDTDIETYHLAAYLAARNVTSLDALTPPQQQEITALIVQQSAYLDGFLADLPNLSEAQARARAVLYSGALKQTWAYSTHGDWPLPFMPTEGSPCTVNCHCEWQARDVDEAAGNADYYWTLGSAEHCDVCLERAANNPYEIRGGVLL